jgi:hypothetical protein
MSKPGTSVVAHAGKRRRRDSHGELLLQTFNLRAMT